MKKRYRAAGVIVMASFISMISPSIGNTWVYGGISESSATASNAESGQASEEYIPGDEEYGPWEILKEPTYIEDGLKERRYTAPDGTVHIQRMTIPKLENKSEPSVEPPKKEDEGRATESDTKKPSKIKEGIKGHSGGSSGSGGSEKSRAVSHTESTDKNILQDKMSEAADNTDSKGDNVIYPVKADSRKSVTETKKTGRQYETGVGIEGITLSAQSNSIVGGAEMPDNAPTEAGGDSKSVYDKIGMTEADSGENCSERGQIKSENSINNDASSSDMKKVAEKNDSFNKYDGGTIVAAGVFVWWYAIVLLPMVKAVGWINRKRKEKLISK